MPRLREPPKKPEEPKIEAKEPEVEVIDTGPEVEVEIEETTPEAPQPSEAMVALQRQLDDLKKSEEVQKQAAARFQQERDQALQRARDREADVQRYQKEVNDSQADAISSALAAAGAEADKAQLDIENAISVGDPKAQAEAQRRLSMATANLARLEAGKQAIEERAKVTPKETPQQQTGNNTNELPQAARDYISKHPEIMSDTKINRQTRFAHEEIVDSGITPYTPRYFEMMDEHLGYVRKEEPAIEVAQPKPKGNAIVSAPVSRDIPGSGGPRKNGKITLTASEVEAARVSGITPEEYAKQKIKRDEMIASGEYSTQR